ncbi:PelD GGDEF domain-containing protein [Legionella maceachernii]|uniref:PelD GGDEF domain-containing protein n=1 Tax=Legionella maceachernii TaxID=466 RepID=A0A0W0W154_9GAMM|nr:PelD GGDEF domain-containing protein [Legionella maceachernii]KTD25902.1 hypothetical protein Lmac_1673 [Legionella maceachernii]SJZ48039.1 protein of unknown function [Legionella maceachernii]SUP03861.1 Uncharacterised protein [Legionella maceachernii]
MNIKPLLKQVWTWREHSIWMWGEAIGITLLLLGLCYLTNPHNPLFVRGIFPWPWIASVIVVFQYGFGPSLLSAGIIAIFAVSQRNAGAISLTDFQLYLLSGVTLILICTLFSSSWVRRMLNADVLQAYSEERLKSLSRSYYMLRLSSDYLEQNIISKPMTLRLAFRELQKLNLNADTLLSPDVTYSFLQLISQFCQVNIGGIFLYQNEQLNPEPFVEIGLVGRLVLSDPLVKRCIESETISFVSINQIEEASDCIYLVAAPLITRENKHLGILIIKEMPFWNLNEEMLRILSILTYYFSQEVSVSSEVADFLRHYPDCSADFANQIIRLIPLKKDLDLDSALVAVMVSKHLRSHNVIYNLKNQHRILDSFWSLELDNYDVLITLMPFTSSAGIHGYITRIKNYLQMDLGLPVDNVEIKIRSMQVYAETPFKVMQYFLNFIKGKNIA